MAGFRGSFIVASGYYGFKGAMVAENNPIDTGIVIPPGGGVGDILRLFPTGGRRLFPTCIGRTFPRT